MATVEGWRIEITDERQIWVYRTDLNAQVLCTGQKPEEPLFLGGEAQPHHPKIRVSMGV
jgi:hypothetical protein